MKTFLFKLVLSFIALALAGIPAWIYLAATHYLQPSDFWQKLAVGALGIAFLGGIQIFLLIVFAVVVFHIWINE